MKPETKLIMKALAEFLKDEQLKSIKKTLTLPDMDVVPKPLRGKTVPVPMYDALNIFFSTKVKPDKIAKTLDEFNDVIAIFLKYLHKQLHEYYSNRDLKELIK